ncbi:MAG: efflux RND transporter permease subunit, partial [Flavobacteriaceae bacterium]|nr:efflux RND transporter permease subunit [Flavobacteriaceae bacterium]
HFKLKKLSFREAAIYSINEVGNPTILATLTVIASVLPMAFVSGLMGPYMSPMPIGASIAMILSLLIALTITPYLGYHFLKTKENVTHETSETGDSGIYKLIKKLLSPLLESSKKRWALLLVSVALLLGSVLLILTKVVTVKMLPFDNKNELQLIIDMPEGSSLERTAVVTKEIGEFLKSQEHINSFQTYVGTAAPITFNGLIRHYDLRQQSHSADIQINLTDKAERKLQSHDIAKLLRPQIQTIANVYNANVKVVEVPPGPPVLSTLVAEIYGPNYDQQIQLAQQIKTLLKNTENVVDVDWTVEDDQVKQQVIIHHEKAGLNGVSEAQIIENIGLSVNSEPLGRYYQPEDLEEVALVFEVKNSDKSSLSQLLRFPVVSTTGSAKPMLDLVTVSEETMPKSIYRKNQQRVVYVMADMAGELESPVYVILGFDNLLASLDLPKGYKITEQYLGQPEDESDFILKWDGEWQITLEVFRDLGIAFVAVIFIIYMLIVGWFQSFKTPIVMMLAIPLSLVGIVVAHWIFNAYFTATSFIGMIALAGIMVRNSVLLIDFANLRLAEGARLKEAVVEAGAVRATPILLTAGTVVIGAFVILFDPIFQGLALSLMGGAIASTILTLLVIPIIYYLMQRKNYL